MVRFSCFHSHLHSHKPKKTVQLSAEAMQKTLEDSSHNQTLKDFNLSLGKSPEDDLSRGVDSVPSPTSIEHDWKSEGVKSKNDDESEVGVQNTGHLKKSLSLGSGLDWKGRASGDHESEDESGHGYSCGSDNQGGGKDGYQEDIPSSLQVCSNVANNESVFSICDPQQSERDGAYENSETRSSGEEGVGESSNHTARTPPTIVKSSSCTDLGTCGELAASAQRLPCSRSSDDLNVLYSRRKDILIHDVGMIQGQERDSSVLNIDPKNGDNENPADDTYDAYNYVGSAKDWIVPVMDELDKGKNVQECSSVSQLEDLPGKDFRIKRIEKWVMDLQHCSPLEETGVPSTSDDQIQSEDSVLDGMTASKADAKVTPGMEAAKKYISSLTVSATTVQLANHGLVVIPFLSAFVSLKALNLSGNAIVRITAGALPRGLHILNLSKNSISTIEGLRELTRLRVLDLSYNRILRIGHGLASCSSLKELYLAGNKISDVEGLHRLLKLNVLDLRFNKLSTTKSLGQLAANYNSLQAISLEGNPAQKNVGDDQLKKYLQGLLPHLVYFNRHPLKTGSGMKDAADRSARLGISAHQIDRGLRSDLKAMRKVNHTAASHKMASSSVHGRKSAVSPKPSRGSRHGRLPPTGIKTTTHRPQLYDFGAKLLGFQAIHRSRSEGTLGVI